MAQSISASASLYNDSSYSDDAQSAGSPQPAYDPAVDEAYSNSRPSHQNNRSGGSATSGAAPKPILNGRFSIEGGHFVFRGRWGMRKDDPVTSEFFYRCSIPAGPMASDVPTEGMYDGHFMLKRPDGTQKKIQEKNLYMQFQESSGVTDGREYTHRVKASGSNILGLFSLDGTFSRHNGTAQVAKSYSKKPVTVKTPRKRRPSTTQPPPKSGRKKMTPVRDQSQTRDQRMMLQLIRKLKVCVSLMHIMTFVSLTVHSGTDQLAHSCSQLTQ